MDSLYSVVNQSISHTLFIKIHFNHVQLLEARYEAGQGMQHEWGQDECILDIGGKARRKGSLGRPRRRWMGNIIVDLIERV
jgi:hypothetical protein